MLKEKKKLTSKIEALSRKVQNLQSKLAIAKESGQAPAEPAASPPPPPSQPTIIPPVPQIPAILPRPRSTTISSTPTQRTPIMSQPAMPMAPSNRVVSGPSSLPRPKTPERRIHPVFKARTPERHLPPTMPDSLPSTSSAGKKRRAPDDFEDGHSMPPQAFTAESLPSDGRENTTPRLRRALQSVHSGFTPVRHQAPRPTISLPSPKRAVTGGAKPPPFIADVTNSPRSLSGQKGSKRSWLGKIRGVSSQTSGRTVYARAPVFERAPSEPS